jgi:hypothetical protein
MPSHVQLAKSLEALSKALDANSEGDMRGVYANAIKAFTELVPSWQGDSEAARIAVEAAKELVKNGADLAIAYDETERHGNTESGTGKFTDTAIKGTLMRLVLEGDRILTLPKEIGKMEALKLLKTVYDAAKNMSNGVIEMGKFADLQDEHHRLIVELGKLNRAQKAFKEFDTSASSGKILLNGLYHSLDAGKTWHLNKGTPFEQLAQSPNDLRALLDETRMREPGTADQRVVIGFDHPERLSTEGFQSWLTNQEIMRREVLKRRGGQAVDSDSTTSLRDSPEMRIIERAREASEHLRAERQRLKGEISTLDKGIELAQALSQALSEEQYKRFKNEIPDVSAFLVDGMYYSKDNGETWHLRSSSSLFSDPEFWAALQNIASLFDKSQRRPTINTARKQSPQRGQLATSSQANSTYRSSQQCEQQRKRCSDSCFSACTGASLGNVQNAAACITACYNKYDACLASMK